MTREELANQQKHFRQLTQSIVDQTLQFGKLRHALDVPEFLAGEIIDLVEWRCDKLENHRRIATMVLQAHSWPVGVAGHVRKHFNLAY